MRKEIWWGIAVIIILLGWWMATQGSTIDMPKNPIDDSKETSMTDDTVLTDSEKEVSGELNATDSDVNSIDFGTDFSASDLDSLLN